MLLYKEKFFFHFAEDGECGWGNNRMLQEQERYINKKIKKFNWERLLSLFLSYTVGN